MTVINTNVGALTARTYALKANDSMQTSMERLSSGLRINSAADDAAGMAVSNKMESQLRGMNAAIRNSQDGISLVQTAEAGMGEITNMIIRMRELSVQMNNGVYTSSDRTNAQLEVTALLAEIDKIANNTAFNDVKVLDGTYATDIRAGNTNAESITVSISSQKTAALGGVDATTALASSSAAGTRTAANNVQTSAVSANTATDVRVGFSTELQSFATAAAAASKTVTYAKSGTDQASFTIDSSNNRLSGGNLAASTTAKAVTLTATARLNASTGTESSSVATGNSIVTAVALEESDSVTINKSGGMNTYIIANGAAGGATVEYVLDTATQNSADVSSKFAINSTTGVITNTAGNAINTSANPIVLTVKAYERLNASTGVLNTESTSGANGATATTINASFEEAGTVTIGKTNKLTALLLDDGTSNNASNNVAANIDVAVTHTGGANVGAAGAFAYSGGNIVGTSINHDANNAAYNVVATSTLKATTALQTAQAGTLTIGVAEKEEIVVTRGTAAAGDIFTITRGSDTVTFTDTAGTSTDAQVVTGLINAMSGSEAFTAAAKSGAAGTIVLTSKTRDADSVGAASMTVTDSALAAHGDASGASTVATAGSDTGNTTGTLAVKMDNAAAMTIGVSATIGNGMKDAVNVSGATVALTSALLGGVTDVSSKLQIDNSTGVITLAAGEGRLAAGTYTIIRTATFDENSNGNSNTYAETITLTVSDWTHTDTYAVTSTSSTLKATDAITTTVSASSTFVDNISLTVNANKDYLTNVDVSTNTGAARAVTILDKALDEISSSQAKLGAVQNRLQHNIDNLSMGSMLTETARGRIVDADFARETSQLSKQQILSQAATSMLAQANQSKQSILALLQ